MKITFVGNFEYNCGSSNTLLGYVKAGKNLNIDVRASDFGYIDKTIRSAIPVAGINWNPDLLVIVYESYPFLSDEKLASICRLIPRSKRIIIDPDGKYCQPVHYNDDSNHPTSDSFKYWVDLYDSLSDVILQPFITEKVSIMSNVYPFLYFAMDTKVSNLNRIPKDFDLLYVGNNWYRWHDIKWLIKTISPLRSRLKRVGLIGQFWSDEVMEEFKEATYSEPIILEQNNIEVHPSAPYGSVESAMSRGKLNPIFIRPILKKLKYVTPRMFETLLANTLPLIPDYFDYATDLYGQDIVNFTVSPKHASENIMNILENYDRNIKVIKKIRERLKMKHNYEVRLKQLSKYI